jgi:hypothetical protein
MAAKSQNNGLTCASTETAITESKKNQEEPRSLSNNTEVESNEFH